MQIQDYTLAQYRPDTFELLAYTLTIEKLVEVFGYPEVSSEQCTCRTDASKITMQRLTR